MASFGFLRLVESAASAYVRLPVLLVGRMEGEALEKGG